MTPANAEAPMRPAKGISSAYEVSMALINYALIEVVVDGFHARKPKLADDGVAPLTLYPTTEFRIR